MGEEEAVRLLEGLVRIPSPSGREAEASAWLVERMKETGFQARVDEAGNAVGLRGSGKKEILLLGHIDTVPGEIPVRREGNLLHGRGTVDAKGPLSAFLLAAAGADLSEGWRITVVGAVEEEAATSKGARHVLATRSAPPDFLVVGEPSRWDRIALGYKGRLLLDLSLRAPLSHSAGKELLPAEVGVLAWERIRNWCARWNRDGGTRGVFDSLDPSLRSFHTTPEGTHVLVELEIGFRLPPGLDPGRLGEDLAALLEDLEGARAAFAFRGAERAVRLPRRGPLAAAFLSAIREQGGSPRFVVKTGTCDLNVLHPAWPETPALVYGPGDSALDHTPGEHIDLEEYLRAIRVLRSALERIMEANR